MPGELCLGELCNFDLTHGLDFELFKVRFQIAVYHELGPSALAVPGQLSNGGGKNVGHSPAESGTDFWALCTTSATLWPL